LAPFFSERSRQLKLIWATIPIRGLERADRAFSHDGFIHVIKHEYPDGQKSPAPIPDQGLFWACSVWNRSASMIPIFEESRVEEDYFFANSLQEWNLASRAYLRLTFLEERIC